MYARLRKQFSPTAMVLSMIAIVLCMGGAAIAASGGLNGKQKKEVKAIAKSFQGTGPAGVAGTNGTNGKDGAPGAKGENGTNGKDGKSVAVSEVSNCAEGGITVKVEGSAEEHEVCNGAEGPEGALGTAGTTLPSNATETGAWSFGLVGEGGFTRVPVSFPIPLAGELPETSVHLEPVGFSGTAGENCPGSAASPAAKAGHLCVYTAQLSSGAEAFPTIVKAGGSSNEVGASKAGAFFTVSWFNPGGENYGSGTFAVTAP
jgi:hypothetical protein